MDREEAAAERAATRLGQVLKGMAVFEGRLTAIEGRLTAIEKLAARLTTAADLLEQLSGSSSPPAKR